MSAASKEYIKWVKEQTLAKDPELQFYNKAPQKAMSTDPNAIEHAGLSGSPPVTANVQTNSSN